MQILRFFRQAVFFILISCLCSFSLAKPIDNVNNDNDHYNTQFIKLIQSHGNKKITIVATIKPFYNLVASVISGVPNCDLRLLLSGNVSPHDYSLKLKDVKILAKADLIIWGGEQLEFFLNKLLQQPKFINKLITVVNIPKLKTLYLRNSRNLDEHVWLSPYNAKIIVASIEKSLINLDPANTKRYIINRKKFLIKLAATDLRVKNNLLSINKDKPYLVFHDAYQYFEDFYGLQAPIVISDNPSMPLSIKRMFDIHDVIIKNQVSCLFKEPQFNPKVLNSLYESPGLQQKLKIGILDPIGADEDIGPDGYFKLLNNLSISFCSCFN